MSTMMAPLLLALGLSTTGGELNFETVKPVVYDSEKQRVPDIWVLDFHFRKPRYIMANIPGKGFKRVWYMTYDVINRTDKPHTFIPRFTLVTAKGEVFEDVILPSAEDAVMAREFPDSDQPLLNSVTIAREPIPPTPAESAPIRRRGVAFWEDVDKSNAKAFNIFVTGLSNGYVKVDEKDAESGQEVMQRKTLKIEFSKVGDLIDQREHEIRFVSHDWIYR
jgi:hypothetical protein